MITLIIFIVIDISVVFSLANSQCLDNFELNCSSVVIYCKLLQKPQSRQTLINNSSPSHNIIVVKFAT